MPATSENTFDAPVAVAYDPQCAQKQLDANYDEMRNGWQGDFAGRQERANLAPVEQACAQSFKATYHDGADPAPHPTPAPKPAWWKNWRLWVGIMVALTLVMITVWAAKRGYVPTVQLL